MGRAKLFCGRSDRLVARIKQLLYAWRFIDQVDGQLFMFWPKLSSRYADESVGYSPHQIFDLVNFYACGGSDRVQFLECPSSPPIQAVPLDGQEFAAARADGFSREMFSSGGVFRQTGTAKFRFADEPDDTAYLLSGIKRLFSSIPVHPQIEAARQAFYRRFDLSPGEFETIHVRRGDVYSMLQDELPGLDSGLLTEGRLDLLLGHFAGRTAPMAFYRSAVEAAIKRGRRLVFTSDSPEIINEFRAEFGKRDLFIDLSLAKLRVPVQKAFLDFLVLCDSAQIIGTTSNFSTLPAELAGIPLSNVAGLGDFTYVADAFLANAKQAPIQLSEESCQNALDRLKQVYADVAVRRLASTRAQELKQSNTRGKAESRDEQKPVYLREPTFRDTTDELELASVNTSDRSALGKTTTFLSRFWDRVISSPNETFCVHVQAAAEEVVNYETIGRRAKQFASVANPAPARDAAIALIFLPHSVDLYASVLGLMTAGVSPSLMPPRTAKQDPAVYWPAHQALIARGGVSLLITNSDILDDMIRAGFDLGGIPVVLVEELTSRSGVAAIGNSWDNQQEVALVQHSSGTTGIKKGVPLSFQQIEEQLTAYSAKLDLRSTDCIVSWLPLYHDMGLIACFVLPVSKGVPFVHMDAFHWLSRPLRLWDLIRKYRGTLVWLPNFALDHLVNITPPRLNGTFELHSIRRVIDCSEVCRPTSLRRFADCYSSSGLSPDAITTCYAMAETVFAVSQTDRSALASIISVEAESLSLGKQVIKCDLIVGGRELVSSGTLLEGFECRVADCSGNTCDSSVVGRILLKGSSVFSGYYRNHERTQRRMVDGWYDTQDIGFFDNGELFVIGRVDDVIICNGKNIFAHELEVELSKCGSVKPGRLIVVPVEDERAGSTKIAVLAEAAEDCHDAKAAERALADLFFSHTGIAPHSVRLLEAGWLIKSTSGKLSRESNRIKFTQELNS